MGELRLFIGGFLQWLATSLFTLYLVRQSKAATFIFVFTLQTLWWLNIQMTVKENSWSRWLAWSLGAATGAVLGIMVVEG